ncbi:MAG TPA: hypothetical protein PLD20_25840, partial [Blastocatellia bacterium]|nr:hypothetical protein [Blastocatellia bacterium]
MNVKLSQFAAGFKPLPMGWLKHNRQVVVGLLLLQIVVVVAVAWQIKRRAQRELDSARAQVSQQAFVPVEKRLLPVLSGEAVTLMQSSKATRGVARFNDSYFAATDGGLLELS